MQAIGNAALMLGGLGLFFGVLLYITGRVFYIKTDPKVEEVRAALPGANCGACGFPGCDGYAAAVAGGSARVNLCPVGGQAVAQTLAGIMGTEAGEQIRLVSTVKCQGGLDRCRAKYVYDGISDCWAAAMVSDGNKSCHYACLGLGSCEKVCQFGAIRIDEERRIAVIDPAKCTGCRQCITACPKLVLSMEPDNLPVQLLCRAADEGKVVSDNCKVGCNGCEICAKQCKFDAIEMQNHLPVIHNEICVGCMMCAETCPTSAIWGDFENRREAVIDVRECIGCGLCKKKCQFEAIAGERKLPHDITEACTGCGQCVTVCPKKCISMRVRRHPRDEFAKVGTSMAEPAIPSRQGEQA